jgi:hypothetical protein
MSTRSLHATGFTAPPRDVARHGSILALIATLALGASIAVVLTVTVNAARAANLF